MALSLIVTGTAWKWILNPGLGLEAMIKGWGWESFSFNWLVDPKMAIYTVVLAGVWQASDCNGSFSCWIEICRPRNN